MGWDRQKLSCSNITQVSRGIKDGPWSPSSFGAVSQADDL